MTPPPHQHQHEESQVMLMQAYRYTSEEGLPLLVVIVRRAVKEVLLGGGIDGHGANGGSIRRSTTSDVLACSWKVPPN
jgi:hypothetical protein